MIYRPFLFSIFPLFLGFSFSFVFSCFFLSFPLFFLSFLILSFSCFFSFFFVLPPKKFTQHNSGVFQKQKPRKEKKKTRKRNRKTKREKNKKQRNTMNIFLEKILFVSVLSLFGFPFAIPLPPNMPKQH